MNKLIQIRGFMSVFRMLFLIISVFLLILIIDSIDSLLLKKPNATSSTQDIITASKKYNQMFFSSCPDISSFDKRRSCFKNRLIDMKNDHLQSVKITDTDGTVYNLSFNKLDDLIEINPKKIYNITGCSSNTFFFDWHNSKFYISYEKYPTKIKCQTLDGNNLVIETVLNF